MVKKLKVVDVAQTEEAPKIEEPVVDKVEEPVVDKVEEPIEDKVEEPFVEKVEDIQPSKEEETKPEKKSTQEIVCEHCNKKMLMKTYKYSHQKVCRANIKESPKEPLKEPPKEPIKRAIQAKQHEPPVNEPTASFNSFSPPADTYVREWNDLRQQRQMVRQQRVRSLISQAI